MVYDVFFAGVGVKRVEAGSLMEARKKAENEIGESAVGVEQVFIFQEDKNTEVK